MKIAVIGHGNVGGTLAGKFAKAGHHVLIGARDSSGEKTRNLHEKFDLIIMSVAEACEEAEVILVATPPQAARDLVSEIKNSEGKVIIDATNAVRTKPEGYATAFHLLEAETQAGVVKCFNTTGFENMADPAYGDLKLDMFMAGDNAKAKEIASQLAKDCGFEECYDFGGSEKVELLEKFAFSWINLAIMQGHGRDIAFKVIRRK